MNEASTKRQLFPIVYIKIDSREPSNLYYIDDAATGWLHICVSAIPPGKYITTAYWLWQSFPNISR